MSDAMPQANRIQVTTKLETSANQVDIKPDTRIVEPPCQAVAADRRAIVAGNVFYFGQGPVNEDVKPDWAGLAEYFRIPTIMLYLIPVYACLFTATITIGNFIHAHPDGFNRFSEAFMAQYASRQHLYLGVEWRVVRDIAIGAVCIALLRIWQPALRRSAYPVVVSVHISVLISLV